MCARRHFVSQMFWIQIRPLGNSAWATRSCETGHQRKCPVRNGVPNGAAGWDANLQGSAPCGTLSCNRTEVPRTNVAGRVPADGLSSSSFMRPAREFDGSFGQPLWHVGWPTRFDSVASMHSSFRSRISCSMRSAARGRQPRRPRKHREIARRQCRKALRMRVTAYMPTPKNQSCRP